MGLRSIVLLLSVLSSPLAAQQSSEYGVLVQAGNGVTDGRDGFHFLWAGVHAGRILSPDFGPRPLRANFEYAVEFFPYFQAFTPRFQRVRCQPATAESPMQCSQPYTVGGTYSGMSLTPIQLRLNVARHARVAPWLQGGGGVLWTNHKFPAYGDTSSNLNSNGPHGDTSIWNFTPQFGIGCHYFARPQRSVDLSANAMHISSASLGDRNPGVNASIQLTLGYSWWK